VAELVTPETAVTSVCCLSPQSDTQLLPNGVRSVAMGFTSRVDEARVWQRVEELQPTHLLLRTPMLHVLRQARRRGIPVVATLADSFVNRGVRAWIHRRMLARELNDSNVLVVGNHGRNACRNLVSLGVDPRKVVPWDWPQAASTLEPKSHPEGRDWNLMFAGLVHASKGIGDVVEALGMLRKEGIRVQLKVFGSGAVEVFRQLAADQGVGDAVEFCGQAPNSAVCDAMRQADVVLVPSRHSYAEGLPLTIYEALRARTPIVASDHPMFAGILVDDVSAKVFRAGDVQGLKSALRSLIADRDLYERLSRNAQECWEQIQIDTKWAGLIHQWLGSSEGKSGLSAPHAPAALA
jgi:glycosyltransferase involved in cell wall biosynthesis